MTYRKIYAIIELRTQKRCLFNVVAINLIYSYRSDAAIKWRFLLCHSVGIFLLVEITSASWKIPSG